MDRSFVALTALLSSATFGAVWYLTAPPATAAPVAPAQVAATSRYFPDAVRRAPPA